MKTRLEIMGGVSMRLLLSSLEYMAGLYVNMVLILFF